MSESEGNMNVIDDNENLCVVCCKTVEIYSIGICNHRVCFECSTRMRVLCNQKECPICRAQMPKVIFTEEINDDFNTLFAQLQNTCYQDRKYGLIFTNENVKKAYQQLMENRCEICTKNGSSNRCTFYTFQQLKDHMRREHNVYYCDICVDNLKIFCFERRFYTKQELGYHRRKGDPDNTSHRGHPLCEFCETRFMDSDELFRHLRRNHHFCYFCDADGKHQYYNSMEDLKNHFRDEHYLCEEGECSQSPLTAVFRTQIDLKAHIAMEHGRGLSKSASKQARMLEFEFTLAPRPAVFERDKRRQRQLVDSIDEEGAVGGGYDESFELKKNINPQDFPALGDAPPNQARPSTTLNFTSKLNRFTGDGFPSLNKSTSVVRKKTPDVTITSTLRGSSAQNLTKNSENFPCLGKPTVGTSTVHLSVSSNNGQMRSTSPKVSIQVNHNSAAVIKSTSSNGGNKKNTKNTTKPLVDAFPAFPGAATGATTTTNPKWVQTKQKKVVESRISKVAPPPQLPPTDLSQFPSLKINEKAKKTTTTTTLCSTNKINDNYYLNNNNNNNDDSLSTLNHLSSSSSSTTTISKKQNKKKASLNNNLVQVVKKRSELKIGELSSSEMLSSSVVPPPGFPAKPPPGFNAANENFPTLSNDLTFTNSSGQSYAIKPNKYHQPNHFTQRNQNLIKRAMGMMNNERIKEFKTQSTNFRNNLLSASQYYTYCESILAHEFNDLFPELLVLLPDVEKQQELYKVCDNKIKKKVLLCDSCKQVIFQQEFGEHYSHHQLDNQFLSLEKVGKSKSNVWKK